jgi:hypothetical protein
LIEGKPAEFPVNKPVIGKVRGKRFENTGVIADVNDLEVTHCFFQCHAFIIALLSNRRKTKS